MDRRVWVTPYFLGHSWWWWKFVVWGALGDDAYYADATSVGSDLLL